METVDERRVQQVVKDGFFRMRRFARARALFLRQYVGHYYREEFGMEGDEPVNMIFHTIRCIVPTLIMQNPQNIVTTEVDQYKKYAYMLGLAIDTVDDKIKFKTIIRRALVDAFFTMGVVKTGLAATDSLLEFQDIRIDPGQVYADNVNFDDWVCDPTCKTLEQAAFTGHRTRVPRQILLDDDSCDHDMVARLPRSLLLDPRLRAASITQRGMSYYQMAELQDYVDIVEVYVPGANTIITIPDPERMITDKYIKIQDYYGPKNGPYRYLALTQPVPGNPFPIAPVGIWYDLHILANRLMRKQMERAANQKTILVADPAAADQAEDMRDAEDSEIIFGNPDAAKLFSTLGAERGTDTSLQNTQTWFNYMSGNPDQMAGISSNADTATQATILNGNANVGLEDSRNMMYEFASDVNSDIAWFLHYDPLIDMPLIARKNKGDMPDGIMQGATIHLTPAQRLGEHFHFTFKIKPKSMSPLDPTISSQRIVQFATNVVPALCAAAAQAMQMGIPFNLQRAITDTADQLDLSDYVQDWFNDPEFQSRLQLMQAMGPQPEGKAGAGMAGVLQNGGYPGARNFSANPINQQPQDLAGIMQAAMKGGGGGNLPGKGI